MSKNRYRLTGGVIIFIMMYMVILFWNKTDIKRIASELCGEALIQTGVPSYAFISNVDNDYNVSFMQAIINDIYPMNDYVMSHENTGSVETYSEGVILGESENSTQAQQETAKSDDGSQQTEALPAAQPQTVQNTQPDTSQQIDTAQVISRNVITGTVFSKEQLKNFSFVSGKFYTVTSITQLNESILRPEEFLNKDLSVQKDASKPQILIFHTHSQETFADSVEGDASTSIVGVGDYLTQLLSEKYGYNVIHDTSVYDYVNGKLDRSKAYTYAEAGIARILEQNPSIEVVIDLHRDGVAETTHLVTEVDGKKMAKIMFFNGLSYSRVNGDIGYLYNPFRDDNLAMSLQMQLLGEAYYPGFLRNIYVNAYRYCLHERGRSMLIEAGAQTNTVQEVKNAMEPLADLLDKLLTGEKAY